MGNTFDPALGNTFGPRHFTEIDIARSLISAKKVSEGFQLLDATIFKDSRQKIINRLYQYILEISVLDELRRTRYDLSPETSEFLQNMRNILSSNIQLQDKDDQIHYGAVEYINFNYKTFISLLCERDNIEQLFDKNAIKSKSLGLEMIQLINESNPYTPDGYKLAIYKCAKLLDSNLPGNMYRPFINYLEGPAYIQRSLERLDDPFNTPPLTPQPEQLRLF